MDRAAQVLPAFFICRAGKDPVDVAMAAKVDAILRANGHQTVLQQFNFANRNFMERMDSGRHCAFPKSSDQFFRFRQRIDVTGVC